jgi:hypothetical protein
MPEQRWTWKDWRFRVADEVRQKFEAWANSRGIKPVRWTPAPEVYISDWAQDSWNAWQEAFEAGKRAGEIARWIPVTEKLPSGKAVLIYSPEASGMTLVAQFYRDQWFYPFSDQKFGWVVTHWQPLPAAPEVK